MKKKILAVALATIMIVIAVTGATLAYMKDSHKATNTFTVGNVKIELTEAKVQKNTTTGNIDAIDAANQRHTSTAGDINVEVGKIFPAMTIYKDPTIKNIGSEDAYIAAKIYVSADNTAGLGKKEILGLEDEYGNLLATHKFLKGGIADTTSVMIGTYTPAGSVDPLPIYATSEFAAYQQIETIVEDGVAKTYYVFYVFFEGAKANDVSVKLFDYITIPAKWDNAEIAALTGLAIEVEAYAVQANGFANCYDAITAAFPEQFSFTTRLYTRS